MTTNELDETITKALLATGLNASRTNVNGYRLDGAHGPLDIKVEHLADADWLVWASARSYGMMNLAELDAATINRTIDGFIDANR